MSDPTQPKRLGKCLPKEYFSEHMPYTQFLQDPTTQMQKQKQYIHSELAARKVSTRL